MEQSPEEVRLLVLDHFAEFLSKLTSDGSEETEHESMLDFATMMLDAVTLEIISIKDDVITATMKLKPIKDLLAQANDWTISE